MLYVEIAIQDNGQKLNHLFGAVCTTWKVDMYLSMQHNLQRNFWEAGLSCESVCVSME